MLGSESQVQRRLMSKATTSLAPLRGRFKATERATRFLAVSSSSLDSDPLIASSSLFSPSSVLTRPFFLFGT